jgi:broad specificity phosphatase PhoE
MSMLAMVRHGQASFFSDNYDQLSETGQRQSRLLGEYWVRQGARFDEIFTGPRVRQIETARLAGEAFRSAGLPWPEATPLDELDEHQVDRLIKRAMHDIVAAKPEIAPMHAAYQAAQTPRDKHRTFQLMFEQVVMLWVRGAVGASGVEPWIDFRQRVGAGMRRMTNGNQSGRRVAAFTSVGAITVSLQLALACQERTAFDLGWRVKNCSITEFVFTRDRLTLEGFNAYPHLEDSALWTFR